MRKGQTNIWGIVFGVLILLLVLSVAIPLLKKGSNQGTQLTDYQTCTVAKAFGSQGQCFKTDNCDGRAGWTSLGTIGCPKVKDQPRYCCYLSDADTYYPANTLLLTVYDGDKTTTLRLVAQQGEAVPDLSFETGDGDFDAYRNPKTGIPARASFQGKLRRYKI